MTQIHPTACVDPAAELGPNVTIGPFCHVGPGVTLGADCELISHVTLLGPATFGANNRFFPQAVLGAAPQDLKYKGGPTRLEVGDNNVFRETVTIHRGTEIDPISGGVTRIGDNNLLMVGVHVAHDSDIGDHVIMANYVQVAGHVRIEDRVVVGGNTAMHHFVTIGHTAYIAGMTRITHDVPPYMKVQGYDQEVRAVNVTGMERWNIPRESIAAVRQAFRLLYARRATRIQEPDNPSSMRRILRLIYMRGGSRPPVGGPRRPTPGRTQAALEEIAGNGLMEDEHVRYLVDFLRRKLDVGIFGRVREHTRRDTDADRAKFYQPTESTT